MGLLLTLPTISTLGALGAPSMPTAAMSASSVILSAAVPSMGNNGNACWVGAQVLEQRLQNQLRGTLVGPSGRQPQHFQRARPQLPCVLRADGARQ